MLKKLMKIMILVLISASAFALESAISGRSAGDVIIIKNDDQIAAWCDFNKQIVVTQFNVLCVYNGNKKTITNSKVLL